MKKQLFLLPLLGLFLAGCSSNDSLTDGGENPSESVVRNYLSINMVAANGAGMRDADSNPDYENGTEEENNVNMVRFFFFDEKGEATPVRKKDGSQNEYFSYIDWYPTNGDVDNNGNPNETVEKILHTTLGINMPTNSTVPAMVLAVVNPTEDISAENLSLDSLRNVVKDFKTGLTGEKKENGNTIGGNFVISNSVYIEDGEFTDATKLSENNFCATLEDAEKEENKVTIYVERVLARLDFTIGIPGNNGIYPTNDDDGEYQVDDQTKNIYVKFLGWNITGTPDSCRLVKKIDPNWSPTLFGTNEPWNTADYHRSFWAINPTTGRFNYQFGNFNGEVNTDKGNYYPATGFDIPNTGEYATTYLRENAAAISKDNKITDSTDSTTKVIIAAQLVNKDGKPYSLAEWAYKKYTIDGLKKHLANGVLNNLYYKETTDNESTFTNIEPEHLTFSTDAPGGKDDDANYYVYVVLTDDAKKLTWTLGNDKDAPTYTTDEVNLYIRNAVNHVKVWDNGYTYYYFDIRHLNNTENGPGYYGVVRNHIYKTKVTSVKGLGTPVYDPDQIIYPEKPDYDESIVSADVKILQWRIVSQDYDLKW